MAGRFGAMTAAAAGATGGSLSIPGAPFSHISDDSVVTRSAGEVSFAAGGGTLIDVQSKVLGAPTALTGRGGLF